MSNSSNRINIFKKVDVLSCNQVKEIDVTYIYFGKEQ